MNLTENSYLGCCSDSSLSWCRKICLPSQTSWQRCPWTIWLTPYEIDDLRSEGVDFTRLCSLVASPCYTYGITDWKEFQVSVNRRIVVFILQVHKRFWSLTITLILPERMLLDKTIIIIDKRREVCAYRVSLTGCLKTLTTCITHSNKNQMSTVKVWFCSPSIAQR